MAYQSPASGRNGTGRPKPESGGAVAGNQLDPSAEAIANGTAGGSALSTPAGDKAFIPRADGDRCSAKG